MARYRFSLNQFQKNRRRSVWMFPLILLIAFLALKNAWYLDNGNGGDGWKIGKSDIHIFQAYQPRSLSANRHLAIELVNRDRQLNGLSILIEDPLLTETAQGHAQDMLERNYYAHVTPDGETPTDRFLKRGGQEGVGENIMQLKGARSAALNYRRIETFQKSWMYSPGHRNNLLNPRYTHVGYGIVADPLRKKVYAVQNFYEAK